MKRYVKKIILLIVMVSAVNTHHTMASWYNPTEFISKTITKIRSLFSFSKNENPTPAQNTIPSSIGTGFISRLFAFFSIFQATPSLTHNNTVSNVQAMVKSAEQFQQIIDEYLAAVSPEFTQASNWFASADLNAQLPENFIPFVQKAAIPAGATVVFHGDLHGNYLALQQYIKSLVTQHFIDANTLEIIDEQFYMVFLGDYADRGPNGVDVYSTLMQLKMKNPDNVFVLRGNHEDMNIQAQYGFGNEVISKFGSDSAKKFVALLNVVYNSLPDALYLRIGNQENNEYIMCCHGLWEFGYDPASFLNSTSSSHYQAFNLLNRKTLLDRIEEDRNAKALATNLKKSGLKLDKDITNPKINGRDYAIGFLWDDIQANATSSSLFNPQRGMIWSQQDIASLCDLLKKENINLKAIYRAHQHGDANLWTTKTIAQKYAKSGIVYTFLAAPNRGYPNSFDAWGQLQVGNSYATSRLTIKDNKHNVGAIK